ncbi:MAG: energy transducer TonB [Muribaculaceae bacterium]|nr:energy transducer TonB [Muribaculaceae bacterium]
MMKDKNKGKKALAVVGAVVAAGLTSGIVNASPVQGSSVGITAADVVAMDGTAYSFDELYAMQRGDTVDMQVELPEVQIDAMPQATKYGARIQYYPSNDKPTAPESKTVYRSVEQMPQFPGGEAALMKYLKSHINYPPMAAMNDIQGNVIVQFVVNEDGSVGEVKVVRSVDKDLDREAIRVIKSLPKFTPGRHKGKAASVWYTLPVPFKLN